MPIHSISTISRVRLRPIKSTTLPQTNPPSTAKVIAPSRMSCASVAPLRLQREARLFERRAGEPLGLRLQHARAHRLIHHADARQALIAVLIASV